MDRDFTPKMTEEVYNPDNLIAEPKTRDVPGILESGQDLEGGALLGAKTVDDQNVTIAAAGGNTGDGALSNQAVGAKAIAGTYVFECTTVAANGGVFSVTNPDGKQLSPLFVGVLYQEPEIEAQIDDGGTDWALGDTVNVTVPAGDGKLKLSLAAALDGSQKPTGILTEDVDASAADKPCSQYVEGVFNERDVQFGTGHTAASVKAQLQAQNLYLKDSVNN